MFCQKVTMILCEIEKFSNNLKKDLFFYRKNKSGLPCKFGTGFLLFV